MLTPLVLAVSAPPVPTRGRPLVEEGGLLHHPDAHLGIGQCSGLSRPAARSSAWPAATVPSTSSVVAAWAARPASLSGQGELVLSQPRQAPGLEQQAQPGRLHVRSGGHVSPTDTTSPLRRCPFRAYLVSSPLRAALTTADHGWPRTEPGDRRPAVHAGHNRPRAGPAPARARPPARTCSPPGAQLKSSTRPHACSAKAPGPGRAPHAPTPSRRAKGDRPSTPPADG